MAYKYVERKNAGITTYLAYHDGNTTTDIYENEFITVVLKDGKILYGRFLGIAYYDYFVMEINGRKKRVEYADVKSIVVGKKGCDVPHMGRVYDNDEWYLVFHGPDGDVEVHEGDTITIKVAGGKTDKPIRGIRRFSYGGPVAMAPSSIS